MQDYLKAGIPWFDYYADGADAVEGSPILKKLKSIAALARRRSKVSA
jgi:hypothetical protein